MDEQPKRRWLRFTLRTWFVALTALCVWLGWWSQSARQQKAAAEKLRSSAVDVDYDRPHNRQPSIRERLANHIGFDFVYNVTEIHQGHGASATSTDEIMGCCDAFPHLKRLFLTSARPVADSDLEIVCRATNLEELWIWNSDAITAQGLMRLRKLKRLSCLHLGHLPISEEGVRALSECTSITDLEIKNVALTSEAILLLSQMRQLTRLEINGRPIFDDVALDHFCALANLTELDLNECQLSGAALKRFRGRVPNCTILLGDNEAPTLDTWEYEKWLLGLRDLQFAP